MKGLIKAAIASRNNAGQDYIEGFIKGVDYYKRHLWKSSDKTPKKDKLLLLQLSNEMLVFGKFEGWGYSFSISEEHLMDRVSVERYLYLDDLFPCENT